MTILSGSHCCCYFLRVWVLWTFRYFHSTYSTIQICLQWRLANVNKVNPSVWSPKSLRWRGSDMQILRADDLWWVLLFRCNGRLVGCPAFFDVTCLHGAICFVPFFASAPVFYALNLEGPKINVLLTPPVRQMSMSDCQNGVAKKNKKCRRSVDVCFKNKTNDRCFLLKYYHVLCCFYHVSFVYICGLCFFTPGWLLRRHLLNIPCFCVARSPDWGRLLLWDHHLHAVQRKEAVTLAEMFEMLMKMRAKEHIVKRTLMSPGHFVCLALTRPNMSKTDRRMFFLSGFLTVCESTHPEKVSCDLIHRAQLVSVHSSFITGSLPQKINKNIKNTSIFQPPFQTPHCCLWHFLSKSYPRRWRIQAFPEIRHHFNVRETRIPSWNIPESHDGFPWDDFGIFTDPWKPRQKKSTGRSWIGKYTKKSHGMVMEICWFSNMKSGWWQLK